jgi:hypothetical protein
VVGRVAPLILRSPTPALANLVLANRFKNRKHCLASLLGFKGFSPAAFPASANCTPARDEKVTRILTGAPAGYYRADPRRSIFLFPAFPQKRMVAEDACGSRRGVCVTGLARFPEREDALNAMMDFGYWLHCPIEWE